MADLNPATRLRRAPSLNIQIAASGELLISVKGASAAAGPHALSILDTFERPLTLSRGLEILKTRTTGPQDWMNLMSTLRQLYTEGALQDADDNEPPAPAADGSVQMHVAMLNDRVRTSSFLGAIQSVVRSGDIVLDIGTGTGILAVAAARAGAGHVYAIEASNMQHAARALFEANGVAERITLINGWSTRVEIPRLADVLVSEIIGDDPLAENVLETTIDARKRMLKPDARMIPGRLSIYAQPASMEENELAYYMFTPEGLAKWEEWYGLRFDVLRTATQPGPNVFYLHPQSLRGWRALSSPILLAQIDFRNVSGAAIETTVPGRANAAGTLNACIVYFELDLGAGTRLSTAPGGVSATNHWKVPVWTFPDPLRVSPGDSFTVSYRYRVQGAHTALQISPG